MLERYRLVLPCCQQDISHLYQIFPDDVLGAGQFGIVYGGNESLCIIILFSNCMLGCNREESAIRHACFLEQFTSFPSGVCRGWFSGFPFTFMGVMGASVSVCCRIVAVRVCWGRKVERWVRS